MPISREPLAIVLRRKAGVTLMELMVACGLTGLVVTSVCGVYVYALRLWDRGQAATSAYITASQGMDRICEVIEQAVDAQMTVYGDLKVWVPRDKDSDGTYRPYWESNAELRYRSGDEVVFYLSDHTGSTWASGKILWRRVNGSRDTAWSMIPGSTTGRVEPVESLAFQVYDVDPRKVVRVTLETRQKCGSRTETLTFRRYVYLRNHN